MKGKREVSLWQRMCGRVLTCVALLCMILGNLHIGDLYACISRVFQSIHELKKPTYFRF